MGLASPLRRAKPGKPPLHKKETTQRLVVPGSSGVGPSVRLLSEFEKRSVLCLGKAVVSKGHCDAKKKIFQTRLPGDQLLDPWFLLSEHRGVSGGTHQPKTSGAEGTGD